MFEKEAEEYREKEKDKGFCWVTQEMEQLELDTIVDETFKDGATFGYNKAKEEMQEQGLALQSDMDKTIEQNIQLKKQIEKMKQERSAEVKQRVINEIMSAIEKGDKRKMLNKFYEICKFIVCLCGTIMVVLFTAASIYIALR